MSHVYEFAVTIAQHYSVYTFKQYLTRYWELKELQQNGATEEIKTQALLELYQLLEYIETAYLLMETSFCNPKEYLTKIAQDELCEYGFLFLVQFILNKKYLKDMFDNKRTPWTLQNTPELAEEDIKYIPDYKRKPPHYFATS